MTPLANSKGKVRRRKPGAIFVEGVSSREYREGFKGLDIIYVRI